MSKCVENCQYMVAMETAAMLDFGVVRRKSTEPDGEYRIVLDFFLSERRTIRKRSCT